MMKMMRPMFLVVALAASVVVLAVGSAAGQSSAVHDPLPIAPNETFLGFVNGSSSNAIIQMACFGPIHAGEQGHPLAGQAVEVKPSPASLGGGFTGKARQITAVLSYPTPVASPATTVLTTFNSYYVPVAISTNLSLPCYGSGSVAFAPVKGGRKARAAVVKVTFVGQP